MKILMLSQAYAPIPGGEESAVAGLAAELAARGHEVAVAALEQPVPQRHPSPAVHVYELDSAVHRLPFVQRDAERRYAPPVPDPGTTRDLRRVLEQERPDVVHAHNLLVHSFLGLKAQAGAGLVMSVHDYSIVCSIKRLFRDGHPCSGPAPVKCAVCAGRHYGALRGPAMAAATLASLPRLRRTVDVFTPVSRDVWARCAPPPGTAHRVIPNFLAPSDVTAADADPRLAQLPAEFVLFCGDIREDKGVHTLLRAYAGLDGAPPLVLLGRRHVDGLERHRNVLVVGPWPHELAVAAMRRCQFAVVPSVWPEPFGMVALEAMASSKPVIASAIGGLQDIVVDGDTGFLVAPGDAGQLRDTLQRLLSDDGLRQRLGANAAARVRTTFSADAVVPHYEAAYQQAIDAAAAVRSSAERRHPRGHRAIGRGGAGAEQLDGHAARGGSAPEHAPERHEHLPPLGGSQDVPGREHHGLT